MTISITGGSGFIGSALIKHLKTTQNVKLSLFDKKKHSLNSVASLKSFVKGKDLIIHLAGERNPINIDNCYKVNTYGTQHLLEAIAMYGQSNTQFIFASSFAIYHEAKNKIKLDEKQSNSKPRNHYGMSKYLAEEIIKFYHNKYHIPYRILRISNPYGLISKGTNGIVSILLNNANQGKQTAISGDGNHLRDFIYIDDLITAITKAIYYQGSSLTVNVCSGKETSINTLIRTIEEVLDKKMNITYNPHMSEKGYWIGNPNKATKVLSFTASIKLKDGIKKIVNQYNEK